jgi:hypothetical protein
MPRENWRNPADQPFSPLWAARFLADHRKTAPTMPPGSAGFSGSLVRPDERTFSMPPLAAMAVLRQSRRSSQSLHFSWGWMIRFSSRGIHSSGMPKHGGLLEDINHTPEATPALAEAALSKALLFNDLENHALPEFGGGSVQDGTHGMGVSPLFADDLAKIFLGCSELND